MRPFKFRLYCNISFKKLTFHVQLLIAAIDHRTGNAMVFCMCGSIAIKPLILRPVQSAQPWSFGQPRYFDIKIYEFFRYYYL
jgi:hypothetical protein